MKKILLLLAVTFLSIGWQQSAIAQEQSKTTVTGKVLDKDGNPLPGIAVKVKGTESGGYTDAQGKFIVRMPEGHNVLIIKGATFETQQIKVTNPGTPLTVTMQTSTEKIGTIHVYGQAIDPKTNTGSVSTVTAEQISKKPITNIAKALDATSGVQLTSGGGQPGADPGIMVRGLGSLSASSSPLIVVDGVVYNGDLSSINPNDVESMSVLKDATASSLYGARGSNGVILITMKKGKKGAKPQINIKAQTGFVSRFLPMRDVITDPAVWYKMSLLMWRDIFQPTPNAALTPNQMNRYWAEVVGGRGYNNYSINGEGAIASSYNLLDPVTGEINPDATLMYHEPWLKSLDRKGLRQEYTVSSSHGTDKSNYYFSLGYNDDQGIVVNSDYKRITTRLSVDAHVTSWLKTGLSFNGIYEDQKHFVATNNAYVNPFMTAQVMAPIYPVHLHDTLGNIVKGSDGNPLFDVGINPQYQQDRQFAKNMNVVASLYDDEQTHKNFTLRGTSYLEAKFLKDFTARVDYTLAFFDRNSQAYYNMKYGDGEAVGGFVNQSTSTITNGTFRQRLVWEPSFGLFASGDNSLALTLDHESTLLHIQSYSVSRSGFTDPMFHQGNAAAVLGGGGSSINELAIESYLAYATYDFRKKYFLKGSFRRDGNSRFSPEARWGNFWSVGGGWMISAENFMSSTQYWLSELKLKASYGVQGNANLGSDYYAWLPNYFFAPNNTTPGYLFNSYGSRTLHWEGSYMFNAGFDYGFMNDRIHGSIVYYNRGSYGLLYKRPFAPSVGIGAIRDNIGDLQNSGIELEIQADIVRTPNFTWHAKLSLTHNENKVTKMQGDSLTLYGSGTIMKKGLAVGSFYMPKYAGFNRDDGKERWETVNTSITGETFKDTTTDYLIASRPEHEQLMGDPWPIVEGAFNSTFTYKGLSLSFQLNFGIGGKYYDGVYANLMQPSNGYNGQTWMKDIKGSWTPETKDEATLPSLNFAGTSYNGSLSNRFMISRTFLKIQNINLSYDLPQRWMDGAGFRNASIFIAADNVYLFAARKGVDIQSSFFGSNSFSYYPYRTVMFGVNLGL